MRDKFYFSTRDLVTIAILSALGGVMSTYIGYLGNLVNVALGVPFGAGQIMAGLHIFFMIVAYAIVGKFGTGTTVGLLKGTVELFSGSTHGIVIVAISLIEGILVDLTLGVFRKPTTLGYCIAGALASMSNVFTFQIIYFSGVPIVYILLIALMAAVSGAVFAGYFGQGSYQILVQSNIVKAKETPRAAKKLSLQKVFTIVVALALIAGAGIYYTVIYKPFIDPETCQITGDVDHPFTYRPSDFIDKQVTIVAELKGQYTYIPPRNYTGVPLHVILNTAVPNSSASVVRVMASDGYDATFNLTEVMRDGRMLLIQDSGSLRLVAADYEGAYWVEKVYEIRLGR
jgi:ABC-type thiamin/hydroxymethylpyrimidine transport system permease subunit